MIDCVKSGEAPNDELMSALGARLEACQNGATATKAGVLAAAPMSSQTTPEHHYTITWLPPRYLFQPGLDPTQFIKELGELGCVTIVSLDASRLPSLKELNPEQCYLGWTIELDTVKDLKIIFKPGFSTADKATDVSGRGGTVSIKTTAGKGTTVTLKLPLTLAIIEGVTVRVGKDAYIVSLLSILESIQPKREMIKTIVGKGKLVNVRGTYLPLMRFYQLFRLEQELSDPAKAILLILETEGERVVGATILGNGTVGFILDIRGLLNMSRNGAAQAA